MNTKRVIAMLLADARKGGNTRHAWDEWFEMKILV